MHNSKTSPERCPYCTMDRSKDFSESISENDVMFLCGTYILAPEGKVNRSTFCYSLENQPQEELENLRKELRS